MWVALIIGVPWLILIGIGVWSSLRGPRGDRVL